MHFTPSRAAGKRLPCPCPSPAAVLLLQSKTKDGSEAHYITSSSSYLRYYASALRSAREHAPSLLPVLVTLNAMPQDFIDWVEAQVRDFSSG